MKKFFLQREGQKERPHYPFWKPWGCLGCFGRVLGFLIALAVFLWLLLFFTSLPRCSRDKGDQDPDDNVNTPVVTDTIPQPDPGPYNPDIQPVQDPPTPFIPDPDDIVEDPDGHGQIDGKHLFVIVDQSKSQANPALDRFVEEFKALYPDCVVEKVNPTTQMVLLAVPEERREEIRQKLPSQITDVAFHIDNVAIFGGVKEISDPVMQKRETSWHLREVLAPEAWDITTGDPSVKVAVIDDYFDLSHPDFYGMKISNAVSVEKGNNDVLPPDQSLQHAHGTHVLGLIGAQMNGLGTAGVAPDCTFMPISLGRAMNSFSILESVLYALHNGANVINASLGFLGNCNLPIEEQVRIWKREAKRLQSSWDFVSDMLDRGYCTIVWASGNENLFELMDYAKRSETVIRVDAVDSKLRKASFSNFGNIDLVVDGEKIQMKGSQISAPGVDVFSSVPGRKLASFGGTSMAAPIVTGAVALMKSLDPTLPNKDIIRILNSTGKKLSNDSIGPLLQIRPALDAIKKNMTGWDEFQRDPTAKSNIWKKTDQSAYHDVVTGVFSYYGHDYLIFETRNSGIIEVHKVGENLVYNARFSVDWGKDECFVNILSDIESPLHTDRIITKKIRLFKDDDGNVGIEKIAPTTKAGKGKLRRLDKDDRVNTNKRPI